MKKKDFNIDNRCRYCNFFYFCSYEANRQSKLECLSLVRLLQLSLIYADKAYRAEHLILALLKQARAF